MSTLGHDPPCITKILMRMQTHFFVLCIFFTSHNSMGIQAPCDWCTLVEQAALSVSL
jgi:hypothetical protein